MAGAGQDFPRAISGIGNAIVHVTLVVDDYDKALDFYTGMLGFEVLEDVAVPEQGKRWVVIAPSGWREHRQGTTLLLGRASDERQAASIGNQTGGRVFLFLRTENFDRDYAALCEKGVRIVRPPVVQPYGKVAVFADPYGNLWDLVEFVAGHAMAGGQALGNGGHS